jgi:two-component system chemotaxis response regulator CheY
MSAPERPEDDARGTPQDGAAREGEPPRILIVEDTFGTLQLLGRMLRRLSRAAIHEARDGDAALREYMRTRPRITFLDINLPNKSGMEVLKEIRALDPGAYVVVVSAESSLNTVQAVLALGIGGFIVKPFSERRVLDVLRKYVAETGDDALLAEVR